jgi:alpha-mannosidase
MITGCSIKEAYDDAFNSYGEAINIADEAMNAALQKISWSIDTTFGENIPLSKESDWILWEHDNKGVPLVLFNPLSWEVTAPFQVHRSVKGITDFNGQATPIQQVRAPQMNLDEKWDTLFIAKIPAMGYSVYRIFKKLELKPDTSPGSLSVSNNYIENDFIRLEVNEDTGFITRIYDKRIDADILSGPGAVPIVIDETDSDTWAHFIFEFNKEIGRFRNAEIKVLETGPVRGRLRVTNKFEKSTLQQDFMLYHDRPDILIKVKLDWRERHRMLKLNFPVNVSNLKIINEIPYGFIERSASGLEEPMQNWVDISGIHPDSGNTYGLALLNDCKYGFSAKENVLSMTVARSPIYADHFAYSERDDFCDFMDQGVQEFSYVLLPHEGPWRDAGVVKKAWELNSPPQQIIETYHNGTLGLRMENIKISVDNVITTVFKLSEDGEGYVLRCYETNGEPVEAQICLAFLNRRWSAVFKPCEIKTFLAPFDSDVLVTETNLIEMEV